MNTHAAEEHYASVLARHEPSTLEVMKQITERFQDNGRPLCRVLQPLFVDRATYDSAMAAAALFVRGLQAVVQEPSAGIARDIDRYPRRRERLACAAAEGSFLGGRVDMLLTSSGPKVLEFNAISPDRMVGGVDFTDALASCFMESEAMRAFSRQHPSRFVSLHERLFEAFVAIHKRRGRQGIPCIAEIRVPPRDPGSSASLPQALSPEVINMFGYLYRRGLGIQLCELADLRYDGESLSANGTRIDIAFIAGHTEYLDVCPEDDLLWRAVRDGAVAMACGYPLGNLLGDKSLMADLSDPVVNRTLDPELVEGIDKILPWTRRVRDAKTTYRGEPIDLLDFIRRNRENLVLKPTGELGGNGLILGWETAQEAWDEKLASLPEGYIVQERAVAGKIDLPYLEDGQIARAEFFFDFNPCVWSDGRAEGAIARVSRSAVLNVAQGTGSVAPVFVLDP